MLRRLIQFHWHCENFLEDYPHFRQRKPLFTGVLAIPWVLSLVIAGASFGAQLLISRLLAPKAKPQIRGKLTGDITLTDSIFGAPKVRIYGARPAGQQGGVEVGCNIIYMSDIRIQDIPVSLGAGGIGFGGGGDDGPTDVERHYRTDIAGAVGRGRLNLLRMKFNEDTVYSIIGGVNPGETPVTYEAEDPGNTLSGGANIVADAECSGGEKVNGIGLGGILTINNIDCDAVYPSALSPIDPPERPAVFLQFSIAYKATGDKYCVVESTLVVGGLHHFPDSGGALNFRDIIVPYRAGLIDLSFYNPDAGGPEIDAVTVSAFIDATGGPRDPQRGPTGVQVAGFPEPAARDNVLLPDPKEPDLSAFERYNGVADLETYGFEVPLQNGASLGWYYGSNDQPVDALLDAQITADFGANQTPAFRDTAYFRITDLDFTKYGTIPAIRCVVENMDTSTVEEILITEALAVGLTVDDLDLTAAAALPVRGYVLPDNDAPAKAFEELGLIYNLSFTETSDGKITAIDLNDRTAVATIGREDLAAYVAGESDEVPLDDVISTVPEESKEMIRILELQFNNPFVPSDYGTDRRSFNFPFTASYRKEVRSLAATLLPEEAAAIVRRELQKQHLQQAPDSFVTTHKYAWVNAGQCINLEIEGETKKRRIVEKTGSIPGAYEMTAINEDIHILADDSDLIEEELTFDESKPAKSVTLYPAETIGTLIANPPFRDEQKGRTGIYAAACPRGTGQWGGAYIFRYKAGSYQPVAAITKPAAIGVAVNAVENIPDPLVPEYFDPDAVVTVDFYGEFNPSTITTEQAADGANPYLIGSEVCIVQTWTRDNAYPNRWVGTEISRILKATGKAAPVHVAGERVVLLDDAVIFIPIDAEDYGVERDWKFVTTGGRLEDSAVVPFTFTPLSLFTASETLAARDIVNLWNNGGVLSVRKADATDDTKQAHGYILADAAASDDINVYFDGVIEGFSGLTPAATLYLSETSGGVTDTPPSGSAKIVQQVGFALNSSTIRFERYQPVTLS